MDINEFRKIFFKMEIENKLFYEKIKNDIYWWDIVRHDIYYQIFNSLEREDVAFKEKANSKSILLYLKKDLKNLVYLYKNKNKDYMFFKSSRNNGKDLILDPIIESKKNIFIHETFLEKNKFEIKSIRVLQQIFFKKIEIDCQKYENLIEKYFGKKVNLHFIINFLVNKFIIDKKYYTIILNIVKPKKIYLVQNGIQKGLFEAAKQKKVTIIEMQHGFIGENHPAYSYPDEILIKKNELYLPDYFCVFSNYWKNKINYPVKKTFIIGNDNYFVEEELIKNNTDITFISSDMHQDKLDLYLETLLKIDKDNRIINLKLHPNQKNKIDIIKVKYKSYPNVKIIFDEINMKSLLLKSECIVTVNSTVTYEALQLGIPCFIIKELNYAEDLEVLKLDGVFLIENKKQMEKILQKKINIKKKHIYFEKFDLKKLQSIEGEKHERDKIL